MIAETRSEDIESESTSENPPQEELQQIVAERVGRARTFGAEAARLCADLKCRDVVVLDVSRVSPVCDVLVLATGASPRQMRAVAEQIVEAGEPHDLKPMTSFKRSEADDRWIALDMIDVVVHLLDEESRAFYDLDSLWGDAPQVKWFDESR